jgi:hypothetical protein
MTVFTWKIVDLERMLADGCICNAHYRVHATNGEFSASTYGSVPLERGDSFVPFGDVTEAMVISWVQERLGGEDQVSKIHSRLQAQVEAKENPTHGTGTPWN